MDNQGCGYPCGYDCNGTCFEQKERKPVDIADAFQIVIDLAKQNVADQLDHPDHHKQQEEAINIIEDLAVNEYGDD